MSKERVKELISRLESSNVDERGDAWQNAGDAGPEAVVPLANLMAHEDFQVARAAKRALWKIVRHAGRPGTDAEASAVAAELVGLLARTRPRAVRAEAAWMLSEIGEDASVDALTELLDDLEVREDARVSLQRIPGDRALNALMRAAFTATGEFKIALVSSLRARGVEVADVPCQKRVPTKETSVQPLS